MQAVPSPFAVELIALDAPSPGAPVKSSLAEQLMAELAQKPSSQTDALGKAKSSTTLSDLFASAAGAPAEARRGAGLTRRAGMPQISSPRTIPLRDDGGEIQPCWSTPPSPVPVKVTLLIDKSGLIASAPRLEAGKSGRGDAASVDERVVIQALTGCAPFPLYALPGRYDRVELDFGRRGVRVRLAGTEVIE